MTAAAQQEWLHSLRNAVNATVASLAVVRRALEKGDTPMALTFLAHAETAGERSRKLLMADVPGADAPKGATAEKP